MSTLDGLSRLSIASAAGAVALGVVALVALALAPVSAQAPPEKRPVMEKLSGVWVEGPGYDVTYGKTYEGCAERCLAAERCRMVEFYRPERKCNLYAEVRPRKKGGASDVGLRK